MHLDLFYILPICSRKSLPPDFLFVSSDDIQCHKDIQCIIHPSPDILLIKLTYSFLNIFKKLSLFNYNINS